MRIGWISWPVPTGEFGVRFAAEEQAVMNWRTGLTKREYMAGGMVAAG